MICFKLAKRSAKQCLDNKKIILRLSLEKAMYLLVLHYQNSCSHCCEHQKFVEIKVKYTRFL